MKPFARRIFNACAAISMALCLMALAAWVGGRTARQDWHLTYDSGPGGGAATQNNWDIIFTRHLKFSWYSYRWIRWELHAFIVPYWTMVILFAILPGFWLRLKVRGGRNLTGLCTHCGYDLRATPDRCPECGMLVAKGAGSG